MCKFCTDDIENVGFRKNYDAQSYLKSELKFKIFVNNKQQLVQ